MIAVSLNSRGAMEIIMALLAMRQNIIGQELFLAIVISAFILTVAGEYGMIRVAKKYPALKA
jgi:Kef-type K+ transport system membrane component KefB